jgi:hypothetical protein
MKKKKGNGFFNFSLVSVELESQSSLGDVESRVVAGVLHDGVTVETGAAFQHHKPSGFITRNNKHSSL